MKKNVIKRVLVMGLVTAMFFNIGLISKPASAEETPLLPATEKTDIELLSYGITSNMPANIDFEKYGAVLATKSVYDIDNADLFLQREAFRVGTSKKDALYKLYDIDGDGTNEMIASYELVIRTGVAFYRYLVKQEGAVSVPTVKKIKSFAAVNAVYCNKKKHYITVQQAESATAGYYTAFKLQKNGKLKKLVKFSFKGKKYKKNNKKISKKAFDKQLTPYCKNGEIIIKKDVPKENVEVTKIENESYMSKDFYYNYSDYSSNNETTILGKAGTGDKPQDDYLAYKFAYDKIGEGSSATYSSEPAITRYILSPSVTDAATGKTYREEDWNQMRLEKFGCDFAPLFLSTMRGDDGKLDKMYFDPAEVKDLVCNKTDVSVTVGDKEYKLVSFAFTYGDESVNMDFFAEGANTGKIESIYVTDKSTNEFVESWKFTYGDAIVNEPEWDPVIGVQVSGRGVETNLPGSKNRTISINDKASDDLKKYAFTITSNENVAFELFDSDFGQFFSYKKDGTTKWNLPMYDYDEDEWEAFDDMINPASGQMTYSDAKFDKGLFWEPKATK